MELVASLIIALKKPRLLFQTLLFATKEQAITMPLLLMKLLLIQLYRERFKNFLSHQSISYTEGKVWSTDGIYRETQSKMLARKAQGAIAVDMECSAIAH